MTSLMEEVKISAQEKWATSDTFGRQQMIAVLGGGWASSYASVSWKKLPHILKVNLDSKSWSA